MENFFFEVILAFFFCCQVYVLELFSKEELIGFIEWAFKEDEFLKGQKINIKDYDVIFFYFGGDVWKFYNILELVMNYGKVLEIIIVINEMVI